MFRRFRRPGIPIRALAARQMPPIAQAEQLIQNGNYSQAGVILAQIADEMLSSNHPRRAAEIYARAAHTFAEGGNETLALAHARSAMSLFLQYNMQQRAAVFFANITAKLNDKGMSTAGETLQGEFSGQIGELPAQPVAGGQLPHPKFPLECPKCGAPLIHAEANWVATDTAECEYCGAHVRAVK